MAEHKYTQMQAKRRKEIERETGETLKNGKPKKATYIRFLGVLRYSEPNPDYREKPKGEDTRTANQRRRSVWHEVTKTLEVEKGRSAKQTDANIT